ncbi:MAG: hypothetical protein FJ096_15445 [Deltaproteobacteria bacterium]|nr:hypothetical protein [Deltaproteobacteria bacterium]
MTAPRLLLVLTGFITACSGAPAAPPAGPAPEYEEPRAYTTDRPIDAPPLDATSLAPTVGSSSTPPPAAPGSAAPAASSPPTASPTTP